jgi:hypothetical protein
VPQTGFEPVTPSLRMKCNPVCPASQQDARRGVEAQIVRLDTEPGMPRRALTDRFCAHGKAAEGEAQTDYFDEGRAGPG